MIPIHQPTAEFIAYTLWVDANRLYQFPASDIEQQRENIRDVIATLQTLISEA